MASKNKPIKKLETPYGVPIPIDEDGYPMSDDIAKYDQTARAIGVKQRPNKNPKHKEKLVTVASCDFVCRPCPFCGDLYYIDGCSKCGHLPGDSLDNGMGA